MSASEKLSESEWDNKFQQARLHLEQGEDLQAVALLEELRNSEPKERVARTLLAMAYSRCDRWFEAENMYRELIEDYPKEILLRVRLATLYMQLDRDIEALDWLEGMVESTPDSKELHSTLGVIYMRLGEFSKARAAFDVTGEEALLQALDARMLEEGLDPQASEESLLDVEDVDSTESFHVIASDSPNLEAAEGELEVDARLDEVEPVAEELANEEVSPVDEPEGGEREAASSDSVELKPFGSIGSLESLDVESVEGAMPVVVLPPEANAQVVYVREDVPFVMAPTELGTPKESRGQIPLGLSFGENVGPLWIDFEQLFGGQQRDFILLNDGRLLVQNKDKLFIRLRDAVLVVGNPEQTVEYKRFQGESVNQVFGPKSNPIVRVEGASRLMLRAQDKGHRSSVLLTGGQVAYFLEGSVLAFSSGIDWENGRVPAGPEVKPFTDLSLDQFWGEGEIILESGGPIWGIPASAGAPVRVAFEQLIGWVGDLIPQIIHKSTVADASTSEAFVEFEGDGGVLISS